MDPLDILIRYRKVRRHRDFDLRQFVEKHFWLPEVYSSEYVSDPQNSLKEHIDQLWPVLTREPGIIFLVFPAGATAIVHCPGGPF